VINVARWTARSMVANTYRQGRVFLAGDAVHIWIPMGGFGMNAGVGDAQAIGWRLGGVIQGWLDPKILDTYELERRPIAQATGATFLHVAYNRPQQALQGLPGFVAVCWFALHGPKGIAPDVASKINADLNQVLTNPEVATKLRDVFMYANPKNLADSATFLKTEVEKWAAVIKKAGITAQ
jgi:hypothetical protein